MLPRIPIMSPTVGPRESVVIGEATDRLGENYGAAQVTPTSETSRRTSAAAASTAAATGGVSESPSESASSGWQPISQTFGGRTPIALASMKARSGVA